MSIMATKQEALQDPNSCWNRALWSEPVFILLGRDKSAAVAIRAWIHHRLISGKSSPSSKEIISARREADEIEKYAEARGKERK